jgi:peptide/nickel transport system substrate-binding protein
MKKKIVWVLVSFLMVVSLVIASCGQAEKEAKITEEGGQVVTTKGEEEEAEEEVVAPTTGEAHWWDYHGKPEYGGTLIWRSKTDVTSWDRWRSADYTGMLAMYEEGWFGMNWTTDRKELPLKGGFTDPSTQFPLIVESWEIPDNFMTFIVHFKEGIKWALNPNSEASRLLNGREFTAYDMEYYWHRMVGGMGSGFEKGSNPYTYFKGWDDFASITATDKYTIVFKLKYSVAGVWTMLWGPGNGPMAKEVVQKYGDLANWKNAVGTGPFMLTDYIPGSSASFTKNPNYWDSDQRFSENQLPYVDKVQYLIIPEDTTAYAALRTGKICMVTGVQWEQAGRFEETNPEIGQVPILGTGYSVAMRVDKEPFDDVNVRKALNMAIDVKTIAETYYGGRVESKRVSYYNPNMGPYYTPFEEWPKEVQEGHTYNPEGARKLLVDAGFPSGFKTNIITSTASDMDLLQIIKGYFMDIGVDMEIMPVEATQFFSYVSIFKKHDQMVWGQYAVNSGPAGPTILIHSSKWFINPCMTADPVYDEIADREATYTDADPLKWATDKEADMYAMAKYWTVPVLPSVTYTLYQPWLKGYSEESVAPSGYLFSRWWIDEALKRSMGQ